jgi:hypothetical protein
MECAVAAAAAAAVQEGRQYLDQLNSSIGRDALMLREAAQAIEEVRGAETNTKSGVAGGGGGFLGRGVFPAEHIGAGRGGRQLQQLQWLGHHT